VKRLDSRWAIVVCVAGVLVLTGGCTRDKPVATPTATAQPEAVLETPSPTPSPVATPTPEMVIRHTVQPGETMWDIASQYGVTLEALVAANELVDPDSLQPGQELVIPRGHDEDEVGSTPEETPAEGPAEPSSGRTYTVAAGDTLWDIAEAHGTTVDEIAELNNLDPDGVLSLGQQLLLP
jgi:LysM repeat protein